MHFDPSIADEDELWLFERIAQQLQKTYGHSEAASIALINAYYKRFTDASFCEGFDLSLQTTDFFSREESLNMADRVQFFEHLRNAPNEQEFIQWQRSVRL
ncbi:hypothetical protein [uncultured Xanthomonas sp.]|uniref:hypothetical protein n=1 Tax=uncultured Xanthomonas sp. TaxID=152831 RepID=UPI0025D139D9|nr:hypothetical protein [uncultured Xanthomonas sp.]